jgi:2',3'-cyclic-nucleotide 2'-phosphodiesterase (5'-nucleotidase family)
MYLLKRLFFTLFIIFFINNGIFATTAKFVILNTTDIHSHILNYNYYKNTVDNGVGLNLIATKINEYKAKYNSAWLFVDNGDTIQGNPLADYLFKVFQNQSIYQNAPSYLKPYLENGTINTNFFNPAVKVLDMLGVDTITVGNHELDYGLEYLRAIIDGSGRLKDSFLSTNIYDKKTGTHAFTPYKIIEKQITGDDGITRTLKVGVIGTTPIGSGINGNAIVLNGALESKSILAEVQKSITALQGKVDLIGLVAHTGIGSNPATGLSGDNIATSLLANATVKNNVDFLITGHSHNLFPNTQNPFYETANVNNNAGTVHGIPATMAGRYGDHLGVIEMELTFDVAKNKWIVDKTKTSVKLETSTVEDKAINDFMKDIHAAALSYTTSFVANTETPINNYFAFTKDSLAIELVNKAQIEYTKKIINEDPKLAAYTKLPVLGAVAPFKNGFYGADDFTSIEAGNIEIKDTYDLYSFPNTLVVIKLTKAELKTYLENSAKAFNTISETSSKDQELLDPSFKGYNFDIIDGVKYSINVLKPVNNRIENLTMLDGSEIKDGDEFLVAINSHRAGSYKPKIILETPTETRDIVANYLSNLKTLNTTVDNNWSLNIGNADNVVFKSAEIALKYLSQDDANNVIIDKGTVKDGFAYYYIKSKNLCNQQASCLQRVNEIALANITSIIEPIQPDITNPTQPDIKGKEQIDRMAQEMYENMALYLMQDMLDRNSVDIFSKDSQNLRLVKFKFAKSATENKFAKEFDNSVLALLNLPLINHSISNNIINTVNNNNISNKDDNGVSAWGGYNSFAFNQGDANSIKGYSSKTTNFLLGLKKSFASESSVFNIGGFGGILSTKYDSSLGDLNNTVLTSNTVGLYSSYNLYINDITYFVKTTFDMLNTNTNFKGARIRMQTLGGGSLVGLDLKVSDEYVLSANTGLLVNTTEINDLDVITFSNFYNVNTPFTVGLSKIIAFSTAEILMGLELTYNHNFKDRTSHSTLSTEAKYSSIMIDDNELKVDFAVNASLNKTTQISAKVGSSFAKHSSNNSANLTFRFMF